MTGKEEPYMMMKMFDNETGEEIPTTDEEKRLAFEALQSALRAGRVEFDEEVVKEMEAKGLTREQIESWFIVNKH